MPAEAFAFFRHACHSNAMRRVLVVRFSSLGDIVLTFPGLDALSARAYEVHYLTKESFLPLVGLHPAVARVHSVSDHASLRELKEKVAELRALGFEHVYDLHRNIRSRIVTFLLGVPYTRVRKLRWKEILLFVFRRGTFARLGIKGIDRPAETLRAIEATAVVKAKLKTPKYESDELRKASSPGYLCVAAESAWREKEWPAERFVEVIRRLKVLWPQIGVVWVGLRKPPAKALEFVPDAMDLTGKLTIPEVANVLAGARLFLGNDSGLMHLAEAAGTPVVAVFGPTSRELGFGPSNPLSRVVEAEGLWCRPCSKTGRWCIRPLARRKCLLDVSSDAVLAAAKDVWTAREIPGGTS